MFDWLFGRMKQTTPLASPSQAEPEGALPAYFVPPTQKQKDLARRLKIPFNERTSRYELSALLTQRVPLNPSFWQEREKDSERERVAKFGADLVAIETAWQEVADAGGWIAAVYESDQAVKAEVLRVSRAEIDEGGKLVLKVGVGKVVQDKEAGGFVDVCRVFELDALEVIWSQVLADFDEDDPVRFAQILQQAKQVAAQIAPR